MNWCGRYFLVISLIIAFGGIFSKTASGQEVVSSGGGYYDSGSQSLSWTIGEPVTETFTNSGNMLTQGFQQSKLTVTSVEETANLSYTVSAFPNPVSDYVHLQIGKKDVFNMKYQLYDTNGKLITQTALESENTDIMVSGLQPAIYFLNVTEKGKLIRSFKITKKE